ncbi:MAG: glycosyltransferase [Planctomycetia bacterium]|nr:glycosyltransferase [Planctomycetia bacterium]
MTSLAASHAPDRERPAGSDPSAWVAARSGGAMPPGAVLLHAPSHAFQAPGGGENQLVQTGRHLETLGVRVRPFSPWTDRLDGARLLHLFGMSREGLELARVARARGVPVVLSPVCWYDPRSLAALAGGPVAAARDLAKWALLRTAPRWPTWRRALLALADAVLPNSRAEARQLVGTFAADPSRIRVVPNGVEPRFAGSAPDLFHETYGPGEFVLYVGRIEPRKNVGGLIEAVLRAGLPLTVIGDAPPGRGPYLHACRDAGGRSIRWLPSVGHDDPILASAYAASRVVALPSWFETPGLAALEAALAGRAVVVTPYGCTREYFGGLARYARPDRPRELLQELSAAWRAGPDPRLARHVGRRFLWSEVARQTAEVYDQVAA